MVDLKTYYRLHSIESIGQMIPRHNQRLDQKTMDQDQPPDDRFEFLVPSEIKAFNLRRKKVWRPLPLIPSADSSLT